MHLLLCLLLGHFLGDFPLQTEYVFVAKNKGPAGIALHASLVGAVTLLLVFPYGFPTIVGVIIVSILHGVVDWGKIKLIPKRQSTQVLFFIDQGIHVGLLVALAFCLGFPTLDNLVWPSFLLESEVLVGLIRLYLNPEVMGIILAYVISLYFGVIWVQMLAMGQDGERAVKVWLTPQERWVGMVERGLVTSAIWLGSCFCLGIAILFTIGVYYWLWKSWMQGRFFMFRSAASYFLAGLVGLVLRSLIGG